MLERTGSFLCLDEDGNHGVLAVQTQESIELFLDSQEAITADPKILKSLKEGTHILCYKHLTETSLPAGSSWAEYTFKADCLSDDDETFLCSYVPDRFGLQKKHIRTFNQAKKDIAA